MKEESADKKGGSVSLYAALAEKIADMFRTDLTGIHGKENQSVRIPYNKLRDLSNEERKILEDCGMPDYVEITITPSFLDKLYGG